LYLDLSAAFDITNNNKNNNNLIYKVPKALASEALLDSLNESFGVFFALPTSGSGPAFQTGISPSRGGRVGGQSESHVLAVPRPTGVSQG